MPGFFNIHGYATPREVYCLVRAYRILWAVHRRCNNELLVQGIAGLSPVLQKVNMKKIRYYPNPKNKRREKILKIIAWTIGAPALMATTIFLLNYLKI